MINVSNLTLANAENTLTKNVNVTFSKGEFWAIIGKNGVGKTTLLETIAGFKPIQEGNITLEKNSIESFNALQKAQLLSYLPQLIEPSLNCTIKQSISYGRYPWHKDKKTKENDEQAITNAIYIMNLQSIAHKSIQEISGGELRKVEIATVLAQDTPIILLDEPLNHLDLSYRIQLMQHLKQLSQNKIIIMVTHDIQYVQKYCSHVLMLLDGCQNKQGTINETLTKENLESMLAINLPNNFLD